MHDTLNATELAYAIAHGLPTSRSKYSNLDWLAFKEKVLEEEIKKKKEVDRGEH